VVAAAVVQRSKASQGEPLAGLIGLSPLQLDGLLQVFGRLVDTAEATIRVAEVVQAEAFAVVILRLAEELERAVEMIHCRGGLIQD
jgi:hypothetical protein